MPIQQFRYHADNLGYVIHGSRTAMAVDGGAVSAILEFLNTNGLSLAYVAVTHGHADHTMGSRDLVRAAGARFLDREAVLDASPIRLDNLSVDVFETPGHTRDSICFAAEDWLVTGDTLFNGTVGNPFSGDMRAFHNSIGRIMAYPADTRVYAGHDYVLESMDIARRLEPDNPDIDGYLDAYDPKHVVSSLADERRVNPYVRFNEAPMIEVLQRHGLDTSTEFKRWLAVMSLE